MSKVRPQQLPGHFGLPRLGVLVEAKYVYKSADFKKIEAEVMIDSIAYLKNAERYEEIVVFIYNKISLCGAPRPDSQGRCWR